MVSYCVPNRRFIRNSTFCQKVTINNDLYVINNKDIFSINKNEKTLMIYIASDWFKEEGFNFFDYKYSINLVKSINAIKSIITDNNESY